METNGAESTETGDLKKDSTTQSTRSRSSDRGSDKDRRSRASSRRSRSRSRNRSRDHNNSRHGSATSTKRVYVANIPFDCKWSELKDLFREKVGDVAFVEFFSDENGKFRGCGIVEMKESSSVERAVDVLHRFEFRGRQLVIKEDYDVERDKFGFLVKRTSRNYDRDRGNDDYRGNRGGRGGGGHNHNQNHGHGHGGNDGGQNDMQFNNFGLNPDFLASLGIRGPLTSRVFVSNLEYKVDGKKLEDIFSCAGTVVNVDLKTDHDGGSKGMAVVEFAHPIEAVQAISMLNGQKLFSRTMNMRMDRYSEDNDRSSKKLPSGLSGIGKGLGVDGQPLHLSRLNMNNMDIPGGTGGPPNQLANLGMGNNNPVAAAATSLGLMGNAGMGGLAALGNLGSNNMNSMAAANMGLGALGLGMGNLNNPMGSGDRSLMGNVTGLGTNTNLANLGNSLSASLASLGAGSGSLVMGNAGNNSGGNNMGGLGMNLPSSVSSLMNSAGLGGNNSLSSLGLSTSGANSLMGGNALQNSPVMPSANSNTSYNSPSNFDRGFERNNSDDYRSPRSSDTVIIRNLPNTLGWETVRERFREIGQIRFSEIKARGTAVIRFSSERDAQRAIELMNGLRVDGRPIEVRLY